LDVQTHGYVKIQLAELFYPLTTHFARGALAVFVIYLMTIKTLVSGWFAHLTMVRGTPVSYLVILSVPFNVKRSGLLTLAN
jgi:hypothetical protein